MIPFLTLLAFLAGGDEWPQAQFDARRSGHAPDRSWILSPGLVAAVPLTDAVFTSPVAANGRVFVVDGSGVVTCAEDLTGQVIWRFRSAAGRENVNNVSSPALAGRFLHFGTSAGSYYILDTVDGRLVREIVCKEPIWASPVVVGGSVYFSTLGAKVYALQPDGTVRWMWDYVKDVLGVQGDRWSGETWLAQRKGRAVRTDQFLVARDFGVYDKTIILVAGAAVLWLKVAGDRAHLDAIHRTGWVTFGLSIGDDGKVYRQRHLLDNWGDVEILQAAEGKVRELGALPGTKSDVERSALSFSPVALRSNEFFRTRPQQGFGLSRFLPESKRVDILSPHPSITPPVVLKDALLFGDLSGSLHAVPLSDKVQPWSFKTPFGKSLSAPLAVTDARIFVGGEDGYLYIFGSGGRATAPSEDLGVWRIRRPRTGRFSEPQYDRVTSFGDFANTNASDQDLKPPFKLRWIRRYEGTTKHLSTGGGGRLYTHTAEGRILAVEEETGRLLWSVHFPGVHISYTSVLYHEGRLLVPQAGLDGGRLRCLEAATGKLLWEAPFAGSPGWTRQQPPLVHQNLVIYPFSSGRFVGKEADWLSTRSFRSYPDDQRPILRAYDLESGRTVWEIDFSEHGTGGDEAGLCLLGDTVYYSCFFGVQPRKKLVGITAAIAPSSGKILWINKERSLTGHSTISGAEGRLYLGGFMAVPGTMRAVVSCLDARDGSVLWTSEPIPGSLGTTHVVTVGRRFLHVHSQNTAGFLLEKETGKILSKVGDMTYRCCRFTLAEPYLLGSNMDIFDASDPKSISLRSTGPRLDPSDCVGSIVSNGRMFYTAYGGGVQACQAYGEEAKEVAAPWLSQP